MLLDHYHNDVALSITSAVWPEQSKTASFGLVTLLLPLYYILPNKMADVLIYMVIHLGLV